MSARPSLLSLIARLVVVAGVLFALVPLAIMLLMSFSSSEFVRFPPPGFSLRWYDSYLSQTDWMAATFRSLWLGTGVAAIAVLLGVPAAIAIDRMTPSWQKAALGVAVLPILLPPVVIAVAMYMTFTRLGLVGTPAGLVAGHLMLALPFVVLTSVAALRKLDPELTRAARSLGAGRTRILFTVTLPLIRPSILSGALLAFLTSFDELVIALFLGSPQLRTLPRRMWEGIRSEFDPTVAAASAMVVVATLLAALALQLLAHAARRRIRPS